MFAGCTISCSGSDSQRVCDFLLAIESIVRAVIKSDYIEFVGVRSQVPRYLAIRGRGPTGAL